MCLDGPSPAALALQSTCASAVSHTVLAPFGGALSLQRNNSMDTAG